MANTRLYLDTRTLDKNGLATLRLVLSHNGTSTSQSLGIRLKPEQWNGSEVIERSDKMTLNLIAQKKKADADLFLFKMEAEGQRFPRTAKELMTMINAVLYPETKGVKKALFVDVFEQETEKKSGTTKACYNQSLKKMLAYDPKVSLMTFDDLSLDWFEGFVAYLDETMSWNGARNYLRNIRATFRYAIKRKLTSNYPFTEIDMSAAPTKKIALSLEQVRQIRTMPLAPWQEEYRDMFLLMIYLIGINPVDLFSVKPEQIINGRLEYIRTKTKNSSKEQLSIKIEPEAWAIINKYRGVNYLLSPRDRYSDYKDYMHHMNDALKTFGLEYRKGQSCLGKAVFPNLTTGSARHTWTTLGFEVCYSVDLVGQGLGHRDSQHRITMVYIKPDQRKVDEVNRAVIDAITK